MPGDEAHEWCADFPDRQTHSHSQTQGASPGEAGTLRQPAGIQGLVTMSLTWVPPAITAAYGPPAVAERHCTSLRTGSLLLCYHC